MEGIIVIFLLLLFLFPSSAFAARRINRYILTGLMTFRYQRFSSGGVPIDTFQQIYNLNLGGSIWDPRFMRFTTGVTLGYKETSEFRKYNLKGTLFPRFRYPFTFHYDRSRNENAIDRTTDKYGFIWTLNFRTLPKTRLFFDKTDTTADNRERERFSFGVDMAKSIGAMRNSLDYKGTISDDKSTKLESRFHTLSFNNRTKLKKASFLDLDLNYVSQDLSTPTTETSVDTFSARIDLSLQATQKLYHSYNYGFYWREYGDGQQGINHSLGASLRYRVSDRLTTSGGASYYRSDAATRTRRALSQRFALNSGINYRLTKKISTSGSIAYSEQVWDPEHPLTQEKSLKRYAIRTGLSYSTTIIGYARFSSAYTIGINTIESDRYDSTSRVSHSFRADISEVQFRYFTVSSRYTLDINTSEGGDFSYYEKKVENFNVEIGGIDLRLLTLSANYRYRFLDSLVDILDEESQRFTLRGQSKFLERTVINASYTYADVKQATTGRRRWSVFSAGINHNLSKKILGGDFSFSVSYSGTKTASSKFTTLTFNAIYRKILRENLAMDLSMRRSESRYEITRQNTTAFMANFLYFIGAWSLETRYEYIFYERKYQDRPETTDERRLMIKAARGFVRFF